MEPTQEWIDNTKKKLATDGKLPKLAKTTIGGDVYIYRVLDRQEHLDIQKKVFPGGVPVDQAQIKPEDNSAIEENIVKLCLLWPEEVKLEKLPAGVIPNLVPGILWFSGFSQPTEPEEL